MTIMIYIVFFFVQKGDDFANDYGQACIDRFQEIWGNNEAMKKEAAKKDDKDRKQYVKT